MTPDQKAQWNEIVQRSREYRNVNLQSEKRRAAILAVNEELDRLRERIGEYQLTMGIVGREVKS